MSDTPRRIITCGVLLLTRQAPRRVLLLKSGPRWDVPKGHQAPGESEADAALRELREETGLPASAVTLDPSFRFAWTRRFNARYLGGIPVVKTYIVLLGYVAAATDVRLSSEHDAYAWLPWPPGPLQYWLIDPLLAAVAAHLATHEGLPPPG